MFGAEPRWKTQQEARSRRLISRATLPPVCGALSWAGASERNRKRLVGRRGEFRCFDAALSRRRGTIARNHGGPKRTERRFRGGARIVLD